MIIVCTDMISHIQFQLFKLGNSIIENPEVENKKTESISTFTSTPTTTTIASTRSRFINFESEMEIKIDNSNTLSKFQFIF